MLSATKTAPRALCIICSGYSTVNYNSSCFRPLSDRPTTQAFTLSGDAILTIILWRQLSVPKFRCSWSTRSATIVLAVVFGRHPPRRRPELPRGLQAEHPNCAGSHRTRAVAGPQRLGWHVSNMHTLLYLEADTQPCSEHAYQPGTNPLQTAGTRVRSRWQSWTVPVR